MRAPQWFTRKARTRAAHAGAFAPAELAHAAITAGAQQIGGARGGDHQGAAVLEASQAGDIEMVHVRVGKQHQVDARQLRDGQRRRHQTLQSQREDPQVEAHAGAEDRVGENGGPVEFQQNRGMTQPRGVDPAVRPGLWVGPVRCGHDVAL